MQTRITTEQAARDAFAPDEPELHRSPLAKAMIFAALLGFLAGALFDRLVLA